MGIPISEEFSACLHGPVGLDIGGKAPEEIALSIVAEILSVLNGRDAKPIRDRLAPLHCSPPTLAYA
jgi:xanthine dehydrogenase accessory factor